MILTQLQQGPLNTTTIKANAICRQFPQPLSPCDLVPPASAYRNLFILRLVENLGVGKDLETCKCECKVKVVGGVGGWGAQIIARPRTFGVLKGYRGWFLVRGGTWGEGGGEGR